jgi:hypothetical protein
MGKKKYTTANLYYLPDDMQAIVDYLYQMQEAMKAVQNEYAVAFPKFDALVSEGAGDHPYSISSVLEAAIHTMHRNLKTIPKSVLEEVRDLYNDIPKSYTEDGNYIRTSEIGTIVSDETYETMTEIARHLRKIGVEIPYMFRQSIASPKVIGTVAILYVARYVLKGSENGNL